DGAVVIVTHSELLLRELATKLIVFQGETPRLVPHDYAYFLETEGWGDDPAMTGTGTRSAANGAASADPRAAKKDAERLIRKLKKIVASIEDRITRMEAEQREAEQALEAAT